MFFGPLENLRRNIGIRLSLWYAFVFTLSSLALLTLAYYLLAAAIGSKDRELLAARLKEAAAFYGNGGYGALDRWVASQPQAVRQAMVVAVVDRFNQRIFWRAPDWMKVEAIPIGEGLRREIGLFMRLPQSAERDFTRISYMFADG